MESDVTQEEDFLFAPWPRRPRTGQYMKNVRKYRRTSKAISRGNASKKVQYYSNWAKIKNGNYGYYSGKCDMFRCRHSNYARRVRSKHNAYISIKIFNNCLPNSRSESCFGQKILASRPKVIYELAAVQKSTPNIVNELVQFVPMETINPIPVYKKPLSIISKLANNDWFPEIWTNIWSYLNFNVADKCELRWQCKLFYQTLSVLPRCCYLYICIPYKNSKRFLASKAAGQQNGAFTLTDIKAITKHRLLFEKIKGWRQNFTNGIVCKAVEWVTNNPTGGNRFQTICVSTRVKAWRVNSRVRTFDVEFWHGVIRENVPWTEIRFLIVSSESPFHDSIGFYSNSILDRNYSAISRLQSELGVRKVSNLIRLGTLPTRVSKIEYTYNCYYYNNWGNYWTCRRKLGTFTLR
jgi:hypothetical protein